MVSIVHRLANSRWHNPLVLAVLGLFAAIGSFAGAGQGSSSVGASAASRSDQTLARADRILALQAVEKKSTELSSGGFSPDLHSAYPAAQYTQSLAGLDLRVESSAAPVQRRSVTTPQPRAPPFASTRA